MLIDATTFRYGIVGLVVLVVDYTLLNTMLWLDASLMQATSLGFLTGAGVGYFLHSQWTFKYTSSGRHAIKLSQFLLIGVIGLALTDAIVYVTAQELLLHHNISKTIAVAASALWAYTASRWWVFRTHPKASRATVNHLLVLSPYYPPHVGGLENHAAEFNHHLAASGWKITVWTANIPKSHAFEVTLDGNITTYRYDAVEIIPGFPLPVIWQKAFWQQWGQITKKSSYSHVLSRTRFFLASIMAHVIASSLHIPHIHVEHGSHFVSQKNAVINIVAYLYDISLGNFILQQADTVIANSKATATFVAHLTHHKIWPEVIYRGVEIGSINALQPADDRQSMAPEKVVITFAGRLISGKGVADLLQAIALCETREQIICWLVGDGPERNRLKRLAQQLGLTENVYFFGSCSHTRTIRLIKASDVIVNTSYTEGLPTTIIEAALCCKAIIATDVGGTAEIIEHTVSGLLYAPKNIVALTQAIDTLVQHADKRDELGTAAKIHAQSKFLWPEAIKEYEAILLST